LIAGLVWRSRGTRLLVIAALTASVAVTALALVLWLRMTGYGLEELGRSGAAVNYHYPMSLTIMAGIGGALLAITLPLLVLRYFFTFFSTVSIGGVMIGSMALVVTLSVMSGFETDLRQKIL